MGLAPYLPSLKVPLDGIFQGDFLGFILALPVALFLAFWMSAVKRRAIVVLGAFIGALIGFIVILGWVGTLIYDQPLPNANPAATFFGSLLICSVLGLAGGIILDLIVARRSSRDYRRRVLVHE
jgi:quinol-cytochrome oxidoreductase complex cytochrome b subunit